MSACYRIASSSVLGSKAAACVSEDMSLARPSLATSLSHVRQCSSALCTCCVTQENAWKQELSIGKHGCSVCKNLFDEKCWERSTIRQHRSNEKDLVCPRCAEHGYAPSKYQSYQCADCLDDFGFRQISEYMLRNEKPQKKAHMVWQEMSMETRIED